MAGPGSEHAADQVQTLLGHSAVPPSWRLRGRWTSGERSLSHTEEPGVKEQTQGARLWGPVNGSLLGVLHGEGSGRQGYRQSVDNFKLVNYYLIQQKVMKHFPRAKHGGG